MTEQAKTNTAQTQLVVIEPTTAVALFTEGDGIAELLADIRQKASSLVPDLTTAKGRKEIASVAHSVARTKTYIDGIGKELTDQYKEIPKRIDANRKVLRDTLDALKDEVRAPLDQYEAAEEARVTALKDRMAAFADAKHATADLPSAELSHYLQQIEAIAIDDSWQEMTALAGVAKDAAVLHLRAVIEKAKEREAQAAELERLRQEAAAREQADRERRIAEEAAAAEAQRQEQARLDAERREQQAKEREQQAIRDAEAAELARQQAESRRIAKAEQAENAVYTANRKADGAQADLNAANVQIRELERTIKAYKAMDPEGLKLKVAEQRKKLEERLNAINASKNEISGYRRDNTRLSRSVTELTAIINQQQADLDERQQVINDMARFKEISLLWGKHLRNHYPDGNGIRWNVYLVEGGIQSDKSYLLNDLDWKLHAMRSDATGCTVMLSEWMSPIFPSIIARDIPMEAIRDIHAFMLDALAITHPHLQPRAEWAQTVHISEIGLNAKVQGLLEDAGITDLWKLMVNQSDKLLEIKGIGAKLADQIISAGQAAVRQWEKEQAESSQQPEQHQEAA